MSISMLDNQEYDNENNNNDKKINEFSSKQVSFKTAQNRALIK